MCLAMHTSSYKLYLAYDWKIWTNCTKLFKKKYNTIINENYILVQVTFSVISQKLFSLYWAKQFYLFLWQKVVHFWNSYSTFNSTYLKKNIWSVSLFLRHLKKFITKNLNNSFFALNVNLILRRDQEVMQQEILHLLGLNYR